MNLTTAPGASVSVGGAYRGRAPLTIDVRPDAPLALVATREGYEPATSQLKVASGERREVELVFPDEVDLASGKISVLAPVGSALRRRATSRGPCSCSPQVPVPT